MDRRPSRVEFSDDTSRNYDHVELHDGYVFCSYRPDSATGTQHAYPWHRIERVVRL